MFIYVPNKVTDEAEKIKIYLPHVKIQPATHISLIGYKYTPVKTLGKFGYWDYFKKRWEEEETFINIEHDIVVWPGALEAIWNCPEDWCVYDFHLFCHRNRKLEEEKVGIPMGCMKISKKLIKKTKNHWTGKKVLPFETELHMTKITALGLKVHQHYPGVVNANKALLGSMK